VEHEKDIGELGDVVTARWSVWKVEDIRESDCSLKRIWSCEAKQNPSCSEAYACCIIHWSCAHAGCSEPGHVHTLATLMTGRIPIDRLIFVEDCFFMLVGAEGVSWVFHYRVGSLVELYSIQLLLINPKLLSIIKFKIVHTSFVVCAPCSDDLMMIYCWYMFSSNWL